MKRIVLATLRAVGIFALFRRFTRHRLRILCYHGVWRGDPSYRGDALFMSAERFRAHLDVVVRGGYPVVTLDEVVEWLEHRVDLPSAAVVITIDDGWYSTHADMWPHLRAKGLPATLYVDTASLQSGRPIPHVMADYLVAMATDRDAEVDALLPRTRHAPDRTLEDRCEAAELIATRLGVDPSTLRIERVFDYMTPEELREIHGEGLDVQMHTRNHRLPERTGEEVEREVEMNRADLEGILGVEPGHLRHFCYPSGVYDPSMHDGLERAGVATATTTALGTASRSDHPYVLPRLIVGEYHTDLDLEAELCGLMDTVRSISRGFRR